MSRLLHLTGIVGLLTAVWLGGALRAAADPVEDLRDALPISLANSRNPLALEHREAILKKRIDALRTIGDLRRALVLTEWKDNPTEDRGLRSIDLKMRTELADRFRKALTLLIEQGDPATQRAIAVLLGDLGTSIRTLDSADRFGHMRTLAPLLTTLVKEGKSTQVRAVAAQALGKINPEPLLAAATLQPLLSDAQVELQRGAAEGLGELVRVTVLLQRSGRGQSGVEASRRDVLAAAEAVVPRIGTVARADDVLLRRAALEALMQSAIALHDVIAEPFQRGTLPPADRKLSEAERKEVEAKTDLVQQEAKELYHLMDLLGRQGESLAAALTDSDTSIRLMSRTTLEHMAAARRRLKQRIQSVPPLEMAGMARAPLGQRQGQWVAVEGEPVAAAQPQVLPPPVPEDAYKRDPLAPALKRCLDVLARSLNDPDVRVRRSALDFLEMMEDAAIPALAAILERLSDSDHFVRWAAARTLGRLGPIAAERVVPALAPLLTDRDLDVRVAAADTLEFYGAGGRAAVPQLLRSIDTSYADVRLAMMKTLQKVGVVEAAPAVAVLIRAMRDNDPRVRRTAADTLATFGAAAGDAIPALHYAIADDEEQVRLAASAALLSIQKR